MVKRKLEYNGDEDEDEEAITKNPHNKALIERKRKKKLEKKREETVEELLEKYKTFDLVIY